MLGNLLQPEIEELIGAGQFSDLREVFRDMTPADCAELIEDLDVKDTAVIFRILPRDQAADVFE
jgi:magnesium transporter